MKIRSSYFKKQFDLAKAEQIGEGNFAQVYRIFDNDLNDSLAIRRVKKTQSDMEDITKQKVINEELRKVQNDNILKIYDIIDTEQAVWYITEYCSGGSLWDVLNICKDNKMKEKQCLECVLQISKGVQQLHNHRITHRDLKPQNILLKTKYISNKPFPLVKLADFGLSTQKIIMETIAGTKQYIAPQQAKFHNYTNAVDVWSLGIICDQILHGTPFYSGQNNKQVFNKILKLPYRVRDEAIRVSIQNFLISLLKKKPYERPIIAVIRKTIERILQQIQTQLTASKNQKIKKKQSGSKDESFISSNHSSNVNKYSHLLSIESRKIQSKKVQSEKKDLNENSIYKKQQYVPNITAKTPRQQIKREISGKRNQTTLQKPKDISPIKQRQQKPETPKIVNSQKSLPNQKPTRQTKIQIKPVTPVQDQKAQYRSEQSEQSSKPESNALSKQKSPEPIQIPIYKPPPKRNPASTTTSQAKKPQVKAQHMEVNQYIQKLLESKKQLQELTCQLKLPQKMPSFLPNTSFTASQFTVSPGNTSEIVSKLKKEYELLNYIQYNDEYDINIYRKQVELQKNRRKGLKELEEVSQNLKQQFLNQVDKYIEAFLDKALK